VDRRSKVELFEQLRREYEFGVGTIKGVARKFGVHRRLVRQAVNSALPPVRTYRQRSKPVLGAVAGFIDGILEADRQAPRKQRHTARRIYRRILAEMPGHTVAESTVRNYVRDRKRALGLLIQETYVPQSYRWGGEAQWYEAYAELAGELTKLQVFCMRSMASGGAFHRAYLPASLSGRPRTRLPALWRCLQAAALRQSHQRGVLRGRLREETERFIALRSHWHFEFCTSSAGHEKGGVEGENGYFRRNHWVPVPKAASLEVLNELLLMRCREDEGRLIDGRSQRVGQAMAEERDHLLALPVERFDLAEISFPIVDGGGCVRIKTNAYSTSVGPGTTVQVKVYPAHLEVWHDSRCVARHERCYSRRQQILDPISMCSSANPVLWRDPRRWSSGGGRDGGRPASMSCGSA
jgi:hypothetical protein